MVETKKCPKFVKIQGCTCRHCTGKCGCSQYGKGPAVMPKPPPAVAR